MKIKLTVAMIVVFIIFLGCGKLRGPSEPVKSDPVATLIPTVEATKTVPDVVLFDPEALVCVQGGTFIQTYTDEDSFQHTISGFMIGKYEVTYELWYEVYGWALINGYTFQNPGKEGSKGNVGLPPTDKKYEPVTSVSWRDCMVWCNAYSQKMGLIPVYYSDAAFSNPIKNSYAAGENEININTTPGSFDYPYVNWNVNGYRLPTEGEWQYAASYIDGVNWTPYNYASGATADYQDDAATDVVAWYYENADDTTHVVGEKKSNALGIYDMSGNIQEWCWDWYGAYPEGAVTDYKGPEYGGGRMARGGYYDYYKVILQIGLHNYYSHDPYKAEQKYGFRFARKQ
ncbi:MAG: hypothetical protein CVV21_03390 [Candidatus Goldiibacteriota bacterium HGW-Goldbacteria-1]|jgi:formylglycine-generating enzyme required for sulfatase activity|nr:MAG: hypothetical protein CVV21_03390 [Candidatus Goldiibacteriota bacterium HGW-Goldbacteria-1]